MKCHCGAYMTEDGRCFRCLHNEIARANRELHMRLVGSSNWYPSHRVRYPKTGPGIRPVNETVEEME